MAYIETRYASAWFCLANRGEGLHLRAGSELVSVFGLRRADVTDDGLAREVGNEGVVELGKGGFVLRGVLEVANRELEAGQGLEVAGGPLAFTEFSARGWPHEAVDERETGVDFVAFGVLGGVDRLQIHDEHETFAGFGFNDLRFGDVEGLTAFHEEWHGGVNVIEFEAEGCLHFVLCLFGFWFSKPVVGLGKGRKFGDAEVRESGVWCGPRFDGGDGKAVGVEGVLDVCGHGVEVFGTGEFESDEEGAGHSEYLP